MDDSPRTSWLYWFGRFLFMIIFDLVYRRRVIGSANIPGEGGVIIASNHASLADPPLVGSSISRPLYFMAKRELFGVPVLGFLIRRTNAFPVKRGARDTAAFRSALRVLDDGKSLLVFPEGTRSKDGGFGKAKPGLGMLACLARVPVVPVRLINSNNLSKLAPITVIIGKPLTPPNGRDRASYQRFSEQVLEAIKQLKET